MTPGQIGYEAYCEKTNWKSLVSGAQLPAWDAVTPGIKEAWESAAAAVLVHGDRGRLHGPSGPGDSYYTKPKA